MTTSPTSTTPTGTTTREQRDLLETLAKHRHFLRFTVRDLTDEQARLTPSAGPLSVGGLVKHVATTERGWIDIVLQRERPSAGDATDDYEANFRLAPDESLADVFRLYDDVARETETVIAGIADLDQAVPVPQGVPWFPSDIDAWSVRWVLLHLISETARHAGHADIVREMIDGATAFPLMAAVEGWPATEWMQPWEPAR